MSAVQIVLLVRLGDDVRLPRVRDVQAGVVLDGLLLDHRHPRRGARARLALPRARTWRRSSTGRVHCLGFVERPIYRLLGTSPEQGADLEALRRRAGHLLLRVSIVFTYLILRIQGSLPLNPQHLGAVGSALSFNTAASFVTNTNWQNYGGETTMSYFSQMGSLTVQQFVSPAVGIAAAIALVRGFSRRNSPTIGNFWVDMTRCMLYILLPIAFVAGIIFVGAGRGRDLGRDRDHPRRPERRDADDRPRPDRASWRPIKQLGTNGGGFFDANSATTFENPTGLTNLLSIFSSCRSRSPSRTPSARWWAASATVRRCSRRWCSSSGCGSDSRLRRAPEQPGRRGGGHPLDRGQHGGQRGPLRRHDDRPVRRVARRRPRPGRPTPLRLVHPDGRLRPSHRDDARRGDAGRHGKRASTRS